LERPRYTCKEEEANMSNGWKGGMERKAIAKSKRRRNNSKGGGGNISRYRRRKCQT
jgi:hypothetical protein